MDPCCPEGERLRAAAYAACRAARDAARTAAKAQAAYWAHCATHGGEGLMAADCAECKQRETAFDAAVLEYDPTVAVGLAAAAAYLMHPATHGGDV